MVYRHRLWMSTRGVSGGIDFGCVWGRQFCFLGEVFATWTQIRLSLEKGEEKEGDIWTRLRSA